MQIIIDNTYIKDLRQLPHAIQVQTALALERVAEARTFADIPHLKALKGVRHYFRIRVGNYRIGLYWNGVAFYVQRVGIRGSFYNTYPPN